MPLAPLRARRRRSVVDSASSPSAAPSRRADLRAVAARIAGLIDGPVTEALAVMLTELYGDALARIIATIAASPDAAAITEQLCADELVGGLLVVHDLHPQSLAARVERALAAAADANALPAAVALERIDDDVVYVRLPAGGAVERNALVHVIAAAAPELARVHVEVIAEELDLPA